MGDVFVEGAGISAGCPGQASLDMNVQSIGSVKYSLVNNSDSDATFNTLAEIVDSAGHRMSNAESFVVVSAGQRLDFDFTIPLIASYQEPGKITVTVNLTIEGAASFSDSVICEFSVI